MKFNVNQKDLQQALNYCQGVIEKRSTLPILSNVLLKANNSKLTLTATDLDLIFIHEINNVEVIEEGDTTTSSSIISTLSISCINIKSKSVAVILIFELLASISTFDKIGNVLLFSITP